MIAFNWGKDLLARKTVRKEKKKKIYIRSNHQMRILIFLNHN